MWSWLLAPWVLSAPLPPAICWPVVMRTSCPWLFAIVPSFTPGSGSGATPLSEPQPVIVIVTPPRLALSALSVNSRRSIPSRDCAISNPSRPGLSGRIVSRWVTHKLLILNGLWVSARRQADELTAVERLHGVAPDRDARYGPARPRRVRGWTGPAGSRAGCWCRSAAAVEG